MSRLVLAALLLPLALPAAAQQQQGSATWQRGPTWQPVPGSPPAATGLTPLPQANNLAPELSSNYQRMQQQRRLNERIESGSALILQGVIPRQ
jgi:hypothetical protein